MALFSLSTALRTQQELRRQLEEKGEALAEALDISSRNAILSNALMEHDRHGCWTMPGWWTSFSSHAHPTARVARGRQLLTAWRESISWIAPVSTRTSPACSAHDAGHDDGATSGHAAEAQERHAMMTYMWGRRWAQPSAGDEAPPAIRDRKFWEGTVLGVAVGARHFRVIAVHADAHSVLDFSRTIGVRAR